MTATHSAIPQRGARDEAVVSPLFKNVDLKVLHAEILELLKAFDCPPVHYPCVTPLELSRSLAAFGPSIYTLYSAILFAHSQVTGSPSQFLSSVVPNTRADTHRL